MHLLPILMNFTKRALLVCVLLLGVVSICSAQNTIYFPHVVDGPHGGSIVWKTSIFLTNPAAAGSGSTTVTVAFTQQNSANTATSASGAGSPFNIAWADQNGNAVPGSGNSVTFQLAGQQTQVLISTAAGAYAGGFATVTSSQPVNGTAVFSEYDGNGKLIGEAGVPAATAVATQSIFVDTIGYNVGVAFANPGTGPANLTLSLVDTTGKVVASAQQTLGPGNHNAAFTSQFFPSVTTPLAGTMLISSSAPLVAVALRFNPAFTIFTTLPPVLIIAPDDNATSSPRTRCRGP